MTPEYYITDGIHFIKKNVNNQYKKVSNFAIADSWDKGQVAKSILNNSIPESWRKTFYVAKYEDGSFVKWSFSEKEKEEYREDLIQNEYKTKAYQLKLYSFEDDKDVQEIIRGFEEAYEVLQKTKITHLVLQEKLSKLEFMYEDVKHYRLKKKLGTVDSYKYKKLGDDIIKKRMSVKNQLEILYKINQYRSELEKELKGICSTISEVRSKKYTPRMLVDLFENDNLDIEVIV